MRLFKYEDTSSGSKYPTAAAIASQTVPGSGNFHFSLGTKKVPLFA